MAVDERSRHQLYIKLEELLGRNAAATLMSHLPPVGWADVATKHDLVATKHDLEIKLEAHEQTLLATFRAEISASQRFIISTVLASNMTLAGLAFAATKLV